MKNVALPIKNGEYETLRESLSRSDVTFLRDTKGEKGLAYYLIFLR